MVYFREVQKPWAWVLFLFGLAAPAVVLVQALNRTIVGHGVPGRGLYLVCGSVAFLAVWFSLARLVTEVRETALSIHFFLLWPERTIPWNEIRRAEAVTYTATGYGVRWRAGGMAYNVSGNRGVRIELRNGNEVLVGSRRAAELANAIEERIGGTPAQ